jgi:ppGpp synthetase/RelA/SpoT-type nucleotidyltranferase
MTLLSHSEIELSLLQHRTARRHIKDLVIGYLVSDESILNPFLALTRLFIRLKSADSILEKINRKKLDVQSVEQISLVMNDLIGFRIITESLEELWAVDRFLSSRFEVTARSERIRVPDEYGYRSIDYALIYHSDNLHMTFDVQLRTALQHYWSSSSFFLFHKTSSERAYARKDTLRTMSEKLDEAEQLSAVLHKKGSSEQILQSSGEFDLSKLPINSQVSLVVVGRGEQFIRQVIVPLSNNDNQNHLTIVDQKMALYEKYPGSAIVECSCMSFLTFALNEPHVKIPLDTFDKINW